MKNRRRKVIPATSDYRTIKRCLTFCRSNKFVKIWRKWIKVLDVYFWNSGRQTRQQLEEIMNFGSEKIENKHVECEKFSFRFHFSSPGIYLLTKKSFKLYFETRTFHVSLSKLEDLSSKDVRTVVEDFESFDSKFFLHVPEKYFLLQSNCLQQREQLNKLLNDLSHNLCRWKLHLCHNFSLRNNWPLSNVSEKRENVTNHRPNSLRHERKTISRLLNNNFLLLLRTFLFQIVTLVLSFRGDQCA